jgi:hypothetical protein
MFCSRGLLKLEALLAAFSLAACTTAQKPDPGDVPGRYAIPCGTAGSRIDTRQLLGLPEQEAVELGRQHGCTVRVEVRDGKVVALDDRDRHYTTIGVTIRHGYVDRLCLWPQDNGQCSPSLG